jgi:hypothetical protein
MLIPDPDDQFVVVLVIAAEAGPEMALDDHYVILRHSEC